MQGNCSGPPSEDVVTRMGLPASTVQGMQQLAPGQCVLVTSKPAFQTVSGNKWFQNLHIAIVPEVPQNNTETVQVRRAPLCRVFWSTYIGNSRYVVCEMPCDIVKEFPKLY